MPHQYPAVEVPGTTFHLVGAPVPSTYSGGHGCLLPTWNHPTCAVRDPIRTKIPRRKSCVHATYRSSLATTRHFSYTDVVLVPRLAYQEVHGAMQARGELDMCQDVLTWLKAACTARGGLGHQNMVPSVFHNLTPVHMPANVYQYFTSES
jgi:hypothetical protein